ncbi:MAG TPA: glycine--tRNA ligase subunit alpha [Caldisericia bacterium]|nr:glycine--tRNA ligase subunit alpha [Caldisericia bacterium]
MYFEDIISNLSNFWKDSGLTVLPAYDMEVGAGTMAPTTFFGVLSDRNIGFCYVQPSRRPTDGRFGENPNRVFKHSQLQVIIKPSPLNIQDIYIGSLSSIGIDCKVHDIRFIEDNWESPTLGAWGVGWEVWLDGMEITQFTYFQQAGGIDLKTAAVEITYGLERIAMYIQNKSSFYDIEVGEGVLYKDLRLKEEIEYSKYSLEEASIDRLLELFEIYLSEGRYCIEKGLIMPAYDYALKCSHTFNLLDSRGALSVTERTRYISKVRELSNKAAKLYTDGKNE